MSTPRVEVHEDAAELATAVAGELLRRLADAQAAGEIPQICLTGGTIADRIHREVARLSSASDVDWTRVVVWWGDERFVAADSAERNELQARTAFLDAVGASAQHVHPMPSSDDVGSAEDGAAAYADQLRSLGSGQFEVMMLGVGPDAHIASLFPGHPALDVDDRIAVAVHDSPKPPPERISLTYGALNRARSVWLLVSGDEKAGAVARALADPPPDLHDVPAVGVRGLEDTTWFLDRPAASSL
ncbi:MAG: 6-phosphogluconolactonase [Actinobacteria bacterium]|uniref:Unannotated protein n=1 Tax=freshwater metagenome TaxID=449393 RepID=A0A6J6QY08_9ZZZZ|nr:6-phosphogluconolactonase [Actinomycetota bacterium]